MAPRPLIALLVTAAATLVVGGGVAPAQSPVRAHAPGELVRASLDFRRAAGLAADPSAVRAMVARRSAYGAALRAFGVPLSAREMAALRARDRVAAAVPQAERWIARHAGRGFAGLWVDQRAGGVIRVGFTRDATARVDALRRAFPYPQLLRSYAARHTEARLEALAARVGVDPSLGVVEVAPDVAHDAVMVGATHPSAALLSELRARHPGVPLRLVAAAPLRMRVSESYDRFPAPPMLGGLAIFSQDTSTTLTECSAGFVGQGSINRTHYWVITAGHCGAVGTQWFHPTGQDTKYPIGATDTVTTTDGGDADSQIIRLDPLARSGSIYINDQSRRRIRWQQRYDADYVGEPVCRSGAGSFAQTGEGNACGFIVATDATVAVTAPDGQTITLRHQRAAHLFSCEGDSGGPVFKYGTALGIVSAGSGSPCGDTTTYTQIGHLARRLHVHVAGSTVSRRVR